MTELRQPFYDHARIPGEPLGELADALIARGFSSVVAHTGGGCMSVSVSLDEHRSLLIGPDMGTGTPLAEITSGGTDVEDSRDPHGYIGSTAFTCDAGAFVERCVEIIEAAKAGTLRDSDGKIIAARLPEPDGSDPYAPHPAGKGNYLDAAWRDGFRHWGNRYAYPDPWLWDDDERTLRAYHAGWDAARTGERGVDEPECAACGAQRMEDQTGPASNWCECAGKP